MAHITKASVSEETTTLMSSFGFNQINAISPNIQWSNSKGVRILHLPHQVPKDLDDIIQLVFTAGYNLGAYQQMHATKKTLVDLVEATITKSHLNYIERIPVQTEY